MANPMSNGGKNSNDYSKGISIISKFFDAIAKDKLDQKRKGGKSK